MATAPSGHAYTKFPCPRRAVGMAPHHALLRQFWYLKTGPILARQVLVGFAFLEPLALRVEVQGVPEAIGDIRQVTVNARVVRVKRRHCHVVLLARANRSEEVFPL